MKKFFFVMIAITGLYLLLYFLTAADDFMGIKVIGMVLLAMIWVALTILFLFLFFDKWRNRRRLQRFFDSIEDEQLNYAVAIDEEKVTITAAETYELAWTEFSCFGIHNDTLYVFNDVKGTNSLYWDRSEVDNEAFHALLELLQKKELKQIF